MTKQQKKTFVVMMESSTRADGTESTLNMKAVLKDISHWPALRRDCLDLLIEDLNGTSIKKLLLMTPEEWMATARGMLSEIKNLTDADRDYLFQQEAK